MPETLRRLACCGVNRLNAAIRIMIACALVVATTHAHAQSGTPASAKAALQAAAQAADRLDFAAVERFAKIACDGGSLDGCYMLLRRYDGSLHYRPNDPQPYRMGRSQPQLAANTLQVICDRGQAQECAELAQRLVRGAGRDLPKDLVRAANLYQKACGMGNRTSCFRGGEMYADARGVPGDPMLAARMLEKACQLGDVSACERLASRYANGDGVVRDYVAAARLYRQACADESSYDVYARACSEIGQAHLVGRGTTKDVTLGLADINKACNGNRGEYGGGSACNVLGDIYGNNTVPGIPRDVRRAFTYFARACELKDARGCYNLGVANAGGIGTQRDLVRAATAYQQSCSDSDGVAQGCINLAEILASGEMKQLTRQQALAGARSTLASADRLKPTPEQKVAIKKQSFGVNSHLCDLGDNLACFIVGNSLSLGEGVAKDQARAGPYFQKACDGGMADGCVNAGIPLIQRGSSPSDNLRAVALFRRACDSRSAYGCYMLGAVHADGIGVKADKEMAIRLMKQAQGLYPSSQIEKKISDALQTLQK